MILGYGKCSLRDIVVNQAKTGHILGGKPEWTVSITNECACPQSNVQLNCKGFQTAEIVQPSLLKILGDICLLNAGQPIQKDAIIFNYAWDTQFSLNPISSQVSC